MKIDLKKLAARGAAIAAPIAAALLARRLVTGKLDVKGALIEAAEKALATQRQAVDPDDAGFDPARLPQMRRDVLGL